MQTNEINLTSSEIVSKCTKNLRKKEKTKFLAYTLLKKEKNNQQREHHYDFIFIVKLWRHYINLRAKIYT